MKFSLIYILSFFIFLLSIFIPFFLSYNESGWLSYYLSNPKNLNLQNYNSINLKNNITIVTGSNTGIGKITVRELAKYGSYVILTSRDIEKGLKAKNEICKDINICNIDVMELDLSSFQSIYKFTKLFKTKYNHLDILILNAGVMGCPYSLTKDGYELQFGTNHLGHFFLVEELLTLLIQSKSRVITVSSIAHHRSYPEGLLLNDINNQEKYNPIYAYGHSKLANILFASELALRTYKTGMTSNSLHPGAIKTDVLRHIDNAFSSIGFNILSDLLIRIKEFGLDIVAMDAEQGAFTQIYLATSPDFKNITGKYFIPVGVGTSPSSFARNATLGRLLWKKSSEITSEWRKKNLNSNVVEVVYS